jgi:hypothetical protein
VKIITRAGWKARRPRGPVYTVPWSVRTEFFVHHTYGPTDQSMKSIQNFHIDGRGWSDIGYNHLVDDDGLIFEGRGWTVVGAHCPGHNRTGISVAYIGRDNPTDAALRSIRWLYDEACRKAGRQLRKLGHGQRYPTECPGRRLQAWVNAGMPAPGRPAPTESWTEKLVKDLPTLREGDDIYDVKTVRANLFARGRVPVQAYGEPAGLKAWLERTDYDHELAELVGIFQNLEGLDDDGIVGPKTWPALLRV